MSYEKEIATQTLLHFDLAPHIDLVASGILLKATTRIFVLIDYNDDNRCFDGFAVYRNRDIERYRPWDTDEVREIQRDNAKDYVNLLNLKAMNSMMSCLREAQGFGLVEIYTGKEPYSFNLGKVISLTTSAVQLQCVNTDGRWQRKKTIPIRTIDFIRFHTSYAREFTS